MQRFRELDKKLTELQQLTAHMLECMLAAGLDRAS
jgi:hypothetical protein